MFEDPLKAQEKPAPSDLVNKDSDSSTNSSSDSSSDPRTDSSSNTISNAEPAVPAMVIESIEDRWEIVGPLGVGGMSAVYKARHRVTGKISAVKVLLPEHKLRSQSLKRFEVEAKAISALDHAHIVHLSDCGTTSDGHLFIVMDFADGMSLAELLSQESKLPPNRALKIFQQIADALAHAHRRGIIHRDLKPNNIMLVKGQDFPDFVKVVDFGIAKVVHPDPETGESLSATVTGEVFGSPLYMSPEQYRGKQLDNRSDIYSMGCLMYETLTGNPPFIGENPLDTLYKHVTEEPKPFSLPDSNDVEISQLESIVFKCLAKDPAARYESMDALKADLARVAKKQPVSLRTSSGKSNPISRKVVIWSAVGVLLLIGIGEALMLTNKSPERAPEVPKAAAQWNGKTLAQLNEEIEKNPTADAYVERGEFYSYIKDQRPNAIADFSKAISLNPTFAEAYRERADALLLLNEFDKALKDIYHAIDLDPSYSTNYYTLARIHNAMGNYSAAAGDAKKGLSINPSDPAVMQELSFAYNLWGHHDDAIRTSDRLIKRRPNDSYALAYRGLYHLHRSDFEQALADTKKAVDLDPNQRMLYAFALEGAGKSAEADAQAAQALREETFPARAHRMRGEMLRYRGQFNEAIESYNAAIGLQPTYALGVIERGVTYFRLNQFKNALIDFDQASQLNLESSLALAWKALAEEKLGQHDAADRDIEKAMKAPTVTADVLANHAAIALERGNSALAKALAQQAVEMNPHHADAYAILAKLAKPGESEASKLAAKLKELRYPGSTPQIGW